jgi:hypothetical protein
MTDTPAPVLDLEDRHAAFLAGYDLGLMHGRTSERVLVEQELRSAHAGAIVARLADLPETHVPRCRAVIRA